MTIFDLVKEAVKPGGSRYRTMRFILEKNACPHDLGLERLIDCNFDKCDECWNSIEVTADIVDEFLINFAKPCDFGFNLDCGDMTCKDCWNLTAESVPKEVSCFEHVFGIDQMQDGLNLGNILGERCPASFGLVISKCSKDCEACWSAPAVRRKLIGGDAE